MFILQNLRLNTSLKAPGHVILNSLSSQAMLWYAAVLYIGLNLKISITCVLFLFCVFQYFFIYFDSIVNMTWLTMF